jgi:VIT1/CCC1 family predicted Fe2+/Mn2+ transporter
MPSTPHVEQHFTKGLVVRDTVIGLADGLTVPFALAAGLTGAVDSSTLVVTAGLAEIAAGSIAMGLGGYLAGKSDVEHYANEREREQLEIEQKPEVEAMEVMELLQSHGLTPEESAPLVEALRKRPEAWRDFMLRFELGLEKPDPRRAVRSGAVIAAAYVAGGLIPLGPYMLLSSAQGALPWSIAVTGTALAVFGWIKGRFTGARPVRSALQTVLIGGVAATAAFVIARAISSGLTQPAAQASIQAVSSVAWGDRVPDGVGLSHGPSRGIGQDSDSTRLVAWYELCDRAGRAQSEPTPWPRRERP